jgi:hypothetical protein
LQDAYDDVVTKSYEASEYAIILSHDTLATDDKALSWLNCLSSIDLSLADISTTADKLSPESQ